MNVKKIIKKEPITYVKINGIELRMNPLVDILEALEDTESFMSHIKIYDEKIKKCLTQIGIIKSTIRGPSYSCNEEKRKTLLEKIYNL